MSFAGTLKKIAAAALVAASLVGISACGQSSASADSKEVIVGVSPIYKDLADSIKTEFDKQNKDTGKTVTVKVFDDFVTPDTALQEGSINLNFYQHNVFLNQFNEKNGTKLKAYDPKGVFTYYMGIYSSRIKDLKQLKDGANVLVPNDSANRARALKTLAANDLITLKDGVDVPSTLDITGNPKNLKITETDVMKEVKGLGDADAAVINSISATQGGIDPATALGKESDSDSGKYSLVVAYKDGSGNEENAKLFTKAIKTDAVKKELAKEFKQAVVPLW
ncbi:MetQ/NlpA family ABC transporter substrate-binding protein [Bifidobacterium simiarum]|nr:MetQ/NlpA family ABC transporter substrate-binding protein [Bifidobacterium simiarum]